MPPHLTVDPFSALLSSVEDCKMASVSCPMKRPIGHMRIRVSVESARASQPFSFSIAKYIQFQLPVLEIHGDRL